MSLYSIAFHHLVPSASIRQIQTIKRSLPHVATPRSPLHRLYWQPRPPLVACASSSTCTTCSCPTRMPGTGIKEKKSLVESKRDCPDTLIVLQHRPVYMMGTSSFEEFLNFNPKGAPFGVYCTEHGGVVTYNGPGQLVMYPIVNLRSHKMDQHWYLRSLEEVVIRALSSAFSLEASRLKSLTGVWIDDRKLAAIGIRVSQWIAYHGLALNVTADLTPFRWIVPCGIRNRDVGSIICLLKEG